MSWDNFLLSPDFSLSCFPAPPQNGWPLCTFKSHTQGWMPLAVSASPITFRKGHKRGVVQLRSIKKESVYKIENLK